MHFWPNYFFSWVTFPSSDSHLWQAQLLKREEDTSTSQRIWLWGEEGEEKQKWKWGSWSLGKLRNFLIYGSLTPSKPYRIALYAFFQLTLPPWQKVHRITDLLGLTSIFFSGCIVSELPIFHTLVWTTLIQEEGGGILNIKSLEQFMQRGSYLRWSFIWEHSC